MNMYSHKPVMLNEVLAYLDPKAGEIYVDGTFGGGSYSKAILEKADCKVIGIDRDPEACKRGQIFEEQYKNRFQMLEGCFGDLDQLLENAEIGQINGLVLDLGVSSFQIDDPNRGFSFRFDGPLDMRMGVGGIPASDIVNNRSVEDLRYILKTYGDERFAGKIANAIVKRRLSQKFETTKDLADLIRKIVPKSKDGLDPATRSFQALRIEANDELGEIHKILSCLEKRLAPNGRLVVVSFHSLEDTIIKAYLREKAGKMPNASRFAPSLDLPKSRASFTILTKQAIKPSLDEISSNSRSSSARLRAGMRNSEGGLSSC
jgi:16S rRNA (cytosine1402-N4)-methyltransferase